MGGRSARYSQLVYMYIVPEGLGLYTGTLYLRAHFLVNN